MNIVYNICKKYDFKPLTTSLLIDMTRGNELLCSEQVLNQIFDEEKMVLLYRFSLEIQKAKNSLDLNLGLMVETDDHIVPNIGGEGETRVQHGGGVPNTEVQPDVARGDLPTGDVPSNTPPHFGMILYLHFVFTYLTIMCHNYKHIYCSKKKTITIYSRVNGCL